MIHGSPLILSRAILKLAATLCGATFAWPQTAVAQATSRPNVVFILADDLGWRDTTPYGSVYHQTPNIARLASRGMLFTNAYSANPLCSPTRASIMTGLYPGRIGITNPHCHLPEVRFQAVLEAKAGPNVKALTPISATRLNTTYPTLAKSLKEAGYATGHFGKWHLGLDPYSPLAHGFDIDLPHYGGPSPGVKYIAPWEFRPASMNKGVSFAGTPGEHMEDRMAAEAVGFMRKNKDRPFLLNYWAFSVHNPYDAKPELIDRYREKADPKSPQRNPVYAAMLHSLDEAVGKLLDTLDELKLADRTIVVFFSDNGGVDFNKERWKLDSPPTSNAPLRAGKATLYEGGTRVPCIVVWPDRVKPATKTEALLSSVDWYPTLLDMTGVKAKSGQRFDGLSQVPALLGAGAQRDTAFCFFPHYAADSGSFPGIWVRRGDWKLIRFFFDHRDQTDRFELYNLKDDIGETNDLAARMPDKVDELNRLIEQHLEDIAPVLPKPDPAFDARAKR